MEEKREKNYRLINMEDVEAREVNWLWYPYIPFGKLTIVQGDPGEGKTTFILHLAALLTKGEALPCEETAESREPVNVIYQNAEDSLEDTIKPRLLEAGADCNRVLVIDESIDCLSIEWEKKGTHEKHLSVLDFEKKERAKEVAELEQTISGSKEELSDILHQQIAAGQETEQIRKEGEAIRQEVSELSATNLLLKEQTETLAEDKEKLLSENEKLEKQQKKLQQELNKMVQSKEVMERNIHAYDEEVKWQLAEPGALMSAKAYRDKKALPLVEKLKEVVKNLTIKCVQLAEQSKKLTAKVDGQQKQISRLTDKVMEQSDTIDRLQEKATDLGRLERHLGREQVQLIVAVKGNRTGRQGK